MSLEPSETKIPFPPLPDQRRIAAILDQADALRRLRRHSLSLIDNIARSRLAEAIRRSEKMQALGGLADVIMGQSPNGDTYNDKGDGAPLLNGPTEFGARYPRAVQWTTNPTKFAEEGDILFCVRGATAGRVNIADMRYCVGRGLAVIRTQDSDREFLVMVLKASYAWFQSQGTGSTFINLTSETLKRFEVPMLSEHDRVRFGQASERQQELARRLAEQLSQLDTLFTSLQHRAFRGEL